MTLTNNLNSVISDNITELQDICRDLYIADKFYANHTCVDQYICKYELFQAALNGS